MKKVLFLSPLPPPNYGSSMSSQMCLGILKDNNHFIVKNIKLNYSADFSDIGKINLAKIKGYFKVKRQILQYLRSNNPAVVYFVPATSSMGLIRDYLFFKHLKKYYPGKILFHIRSRLSQWDRLVSRRIYQKMFEKNKAIILGEELKSDLRGLVSKSDLFILPNAITNEVVDKEFDRILSLRKKRNSFNILFLSNMDLDKGWFRLLESCSLLNKKNIDFKCNFAGAWPSKKEKRIFENYIQKNNLKKKINYLGELHGREKKDILINSDILVFPTTYSLETFGRVIIEAMMYGLPVIANGIATIPSIIREGNTGFVLKTNSKEEIIKRLELFLKDRKKIISFGKNGRKRFLENYEIKKYSEQFLIIIDSV